MNWSGSNWPWSSPLYLLFNLEKRIYLRMSVTNSGFAKRGIADCRQDFVTCWEPSKNERKSTSGTSPITVRVTKTVLEGGVEEILVSSLTDMETVTREEMVKLYSMRWGGGRRNQEPQAKDETRTLRFQKAGRNISGIPRPYLCNEPGGSDRVGRR